MALYIPHAHCVDALSHPISIDLEHRTQRGFLISPLCGELAESYSPSHLQWKLTTCRGIQLWLRVVSRSLEVIIITNICPTCPLRSHWIWETSCGDLSSFCFLCWSPWIYGKHVLDICCRGILPVSFIHLQRFLSALWLLKHCWNVCTCFYY